MINSTVKYFFFCCFIFTSFFLAAQADTNKVKPDGYNIFYFDNGMKSSEGPMVNGKPDGYWKNYYMNGVLKNEGNRKNFLLDSVWKFYDERGKLLKTINYSKGKKNGFIVNYDTSGKIVSRENYVEDIKSGKSYSYHKNKRVHFVVPFVRGKMEGEALEFSEDSVLIGVTYYKGGFIDRTEKMNRVGDDGKKQGKWKEFYEDGSVKKEMTYRDGTLDGYVKEYDKKGNIKNTEKFFAGKKIENPKELRDIQFYKEFYSTGKLKYEGGFLDSFPHGFHYYYNENGTTDSVLYYEEGFMLEKGKTDSMKQKVGKWTEYFVTGEIRGTGNYKGGKKIGDWKYFYGSGNAEQTGSYNSSGLQDGEWIWLYENGKTLRQENYIDGKRNGPLTDYNDDGKVISSGEFIDGNREGFWIYEMGNYLEKGNYVAGERDSIWNAWWTTSGKLRYNGKWTQGTPEGKHVWFFENGKKMFEGNFTGGERDGDWRFYDETGVLFLVITYENDQEIAFNGVKVYPTYEEAMSIFEEFKQSAGEKKKENNNKETEKDKEE